MFSHVLALSGVLLLRKDRPNWPRPFKLAKPWMVLAGIFAVLNLTFIVFGIVFMDYTGYLWNADFSDPWAKVPELIGVAAGSLAVGILGYVIAQRQHGRPFRWQEPSDEAPSAEAIEGAAAAAAARAR
jgi:amino acid transporter